MLSPLANNQVIQHEIANVLIAMEQAKSMTLLAAIEAAKATDLMRPSVLSAAKFYVGNAARTVAKKCIQMHGAMGLTNDLAVSHYAKRLTMIDFWFGSGRSHLTKFIEQESSQIS